MDKYKLDHHILFTHDDFKDLLISNTFRSIALTMISLFVPIFLYKIGFSIQEIIGFELIMLTVSLIAHFINTRVASLIGLKKLLILSYIISMFNYLSLYSYEFLIMSTSRYAYLALIILLNAWSFTMFWTAFHLYYLKITKYSEKTSKFGTLKAIPVMFSILSPFLGGLLITTMGFQFTFSIVAGLLAIGAFFLLFSKEINIDYRTDFRKIIDKGNMKKNAVFFLEGFMYLATGFLWPLFIFLSSITIMTIGIFYLLSNLLHSLFTILGGRWSDKYGNHTMAKIGCVTWGGSIVLRALQKTSLAMSAMQGLGGVTGAVFTVSLHGLFYRVSHKDPQDSMLNRELYMHLGRISALLITAAVMQFTSIVTAFTFGLIMCGMASLFMVRVVRHLDPVN